ncbi:hypothetical protein [Micromonospora sp. NPDC003241]
MKAPETRAARAEAAGQLSTFEFDGETYAVAPTDQWDLGALDAIEDGRILAAVRIILGAEQVDRFRAKPRTFGDLNSFFDAAQKAAGVKGN